MHFGGDTRDTPSSDDPLNGYEMGHYMLDGRSPVRAPGEGERRVRADIDLTMGSDDELRLGPRIQEDPFVQHITPYRYTDGGRDTKLQMQFPQFPMEQEGDGDGDEDEDDNGEDNDAFDDEQKARESKNDSDDSDERGERDDVEELEEQEEEEPEEREELEEDAEQDDEAGCTDAVQRVLEADDSSSDIASSSDDEETTIYRMPTDVRAEILEEIADLLHSVPQLREEYDVIDRLGTGTFSSVYKAVDLCYHTKWDNTPWLGRHPSSSSAHYQSVPQPSGSKVFVAIKRIYVTSSPDRIRSEIAIMKDCRGCRHVSQLITAFRHEDQVVAIMPFQRNDDFREYFQVLPMEGIKSYFRCLFRALRDVHTRQIIHRDVKPANFLFDPRTGIGTLCDFGLACRMHGPANTVGLCLHTSPTLQEPHGRFRAWDMEIEYIKHMQRDSRLRSSWPSERVGYMSKDTRPPSKANRSGTRGFRAPEVLLKCSDQSGAIDMWSAGMILLFFLTCKFPMFQSSNDVEALMEIAAIIGRKRMEKAAALHSRTFTTNLPSISMNGMTWVEFVKRQNLTLLQPRPENPRYYPYNKRRLQPQPPPSPPYTTLIAQALSLLDRLLNPDCVQRITPREALEHPFLSIDGEDDDEWAPQLYGRGVCGEWHFVGEDGVQCVRVRGEEGKWTVQKLEAGEGIAIGNRPCEYHNEM